MGQTLMYCVAVCRKEVSSARDSVDRIIALLSERQNRDHRSRRLGTPCLSVEKSQSPGKIFIRAGEFQGAQAHVCRASSLTARTWHRRCVDSQ